MLEQPIALPCPPQPMERPAQLPPPLRRLQPDATIRSCQLCDNPSELHMSPVRVSGRHQHSQRYRPLQHRYFEGFQRNFLENRAQNWRLFARSADWIFLISTTYASCTSLCGQQQERSPQSLLKMTHGKPHKLTRAEAAIFSDMKGPENERLSQAHNASRIVTRTAV